VIGPTGLGLGESGTLYVADTLGNRIAAIPNALFPNSNASAGDTVSSNGALNGPLGLAIAPGGDILTANGGDGNLVETTAGGAQVTVKNVDTSNMGAGMLFGLAVSRSGNGVYLVDDGNNTLNQLH
jgi:DNA-binding beta-propeller fold protein YncE